MPKLFKVEKPVIGMVHLRPLPGSPGSPGFKEVLKWALRDAEALVGGGVDGLLVENLGDAPFYPDKVPPHVVSCMSVVVWEVRKRFDVPVGVNVLRNDVESAVAIASATGAEFVRVNVHVGCVATDQGIIQGKAHLTMRYRELLGSRVKVFADIAVKHGKPLYDVSLTQLAKDTFYRGRADALIVTGPETGAEARVEDIVEVKQAVPEAPVFVGSGVTASNVRRYLRHADGVIVGTYLKRDGMITNPVDIDRVRLLIKAAREP